MQDKVFDTLLERLQEKISSSRYIMCENKPRLVDTKEYTLTQGQELHVQMFIFGAGTIIVVHEATQNVESWKIVSFRSPHGQWWVNVT